MLGVLLNAAHGLHLSRVHKKVASLLDLEVKVCLGEGQLLVLHKHAECRRAALSSAIHGVDEDLERVRA